MARMILLRGVGYHQKEIAKELGVTPSAVGYQLNRLKKLTKEHGAEKVFTYYIRGSLLKGKEEGFKALGEEVSEEWLEE